MADEIIKKPAWLKTRLPEGKSYLAVREIVRKNQLHTICTSGTCPNIGECWGRGTATLMILGDTCTRACKFCNVITGKPLPADCNEPGRVADAVRLMKVRHCVLTSVTRDDLPDQGSGIWAETILKVKELNPAVTIEALVPDFSGIREFLDKVISAEPDVLSHNLETVERLTPLIRTKADYRTSLEVIRHISLSGSRSKSGIMLGLGESPEEVLQTMDDLRKAGCQVMTIGQYLQPAHDNIPVWEYIHPDVFKYYETEGLKRGFLFMESSPLVRSSYHAEKHAAK